jgi:hypothetical protein
MIISDLNYVEVAEATEVKGGGDVFQYNPTQQVAVARVGGGNTRNIIASPAVAVNLNLNALTGISAL